VTLSQEKAEKAKQNTPKATDKEVLTEASMSGFLRPEPTTPHRAKTTKKK
jgi:hypothetical protein